MNPKLNELKYNSRAGKYTPVIRVYTTKAGRPQFFKVVSGELRSLYNPYIYWSYVSDRPMYPAIKNWLIRVTGWRI